MLTKPKDMTMTGKERVMCAVNHREPDYVPIFEVFFSRKFFKEMIGYVPETLDPVASTELAVKVGYDYTLVSMGGTAGYTVGGTGLEYQDEWGVTYRKDPDAWPMDGPLAYPMKTAEDWKNYTMPDPALESRYTAIREAVKLSAEHKMALVANVRGPFSGAWMCFGMDHFFPFMYKNPALVDDVLTKMADFAIYGSVKMIELGVDIIQLADDYGHNQSPLLSPKHFQRFVAPQLKRIVDAIHKAGGKITLHSDGHIMPVLESCVAQGIDGLNPIQRTAGMDIAVVKKLYGDKVCLFGNVDQRDLMVNGTAEEVAEQTKEVIRIAAPGGGLCLGSDHSIHDDIPTENILAIVETGRKFGKYPINL
ncbi:MAG: hypothetical protein LBV79_06430 [Candidatus Adiutrix sp.]|jgi:uroporphyrinogen decarboxylase|nr:hypothetical protein [Candidatus Adiutrix sp.]